MNIIFELTRSVLQASSAVSDKTIDAVNLLSLARDRAFKSRKTSTQNNFAFLLFHADEVLGRGNFGIVKKAVLKHHTEENHEEVVAVKSLTGLCVFAFYCPQSLSNLCQIIKRCQQNTALLDLLTFQLRFSNLDFQIAAKVLNFCLQSKFESVSFILTVSVVV